MTIYGIDISRFQAGIDLRAVTTDFVLAKLGEGMQTRDNMFHTYRAQAEEAGLLFGAYYYLRGDSTPAEQAKNAFGALGGHKIPLTIDLERTNGSPQPNLATAVAFTKAARALGVLVTDLLYFPEWYWTEIGRPNTANSPLWQSDYGPNDGKYPGDTSTRWLSMGRQASILQFTSVGRVSGYTKDIDRDAFRGTREELAQTGWFIDYKEPELTKEEIQAAVQSTPILVDTANSTYEPLQKVLRRIVNRPDPDPKAIALAVVQALPAGSDLTVAQVEEAVKTALREGVGG